MNGRSPDGWGRVFRNRGIIEAELWQSLQSDLFVEPAHNLSRVEAYPSHLLLPKNDGPKAAGVENERALSSPTSTAPNDPHDDNEIKRRQLIALRTSEDVTEYVGQTHKFRAFFIRQRYSWGPLLITSHLFGELLVQVHISPLIKSFVQYFGVREREVEISPPALRFVRLFPHKKASHGAHECIYGLRFMERNSRIDADKPSFGWSLRQSAICCRYVPEECGASWLFVTISQSMQQRLDSVVVGNGSSEDLDPFEIHFLLIDSAISSWRPYLIDLSAETDAQNAQLLGTSPTGDGPIGLHETDRRQELLILDGKLLNALLAINATANTLAALTAAWESTIKFSPTAAPEDMEIIRASFLDQNRDLHLIKTQIVNLRTKLAGISNLLSSFLDLSSGFSLQNLVKESSKENEEMRKLSERMHILAEKSTHDAAAVKVLTILTLIYLPITVVSNFFSTSFVNSRTLPDGSEGIIVYGDWWILLAVSIPLTLITIYIWLVWTQIQANRSNQPWWWYVVGARLFTRESKTSTATNIRENWRHDTDRTIATHGEADKAIPSPTLYRPSYELC